MHPDEVALLKAVCAAPDDDLPRLVYADWLDEQGRSVRADFIRSQIELFRLEAWFANFGTRDLRKRHGTEYGRRIGPLRKRIGKLLAKHRADATGTTDPLPQYWQAKYERGFLASVQLDASEVGTLTEFIHDAALVPTVIVDNLGNWLCDHTDEVMRVAADGSVTWHTEATLSPTVFDHAESWACVTALEFDDRFGHGWDVSRINPHRLPTTPVTLPRLTRLSFDYGRLDDSNLALLLGRLHLPAMKHLNLANNELTAVGLGHILRDEFAEKLVTLDLSGNRVQPWTVVNALCERRLPKLKSLLVRQVGRTAYSPRLLARFQQSYPDTVLDM